MIFHPLVFTVAPAAPAIPYALIALTLLLRFLVALGLLYLWAQTFHRLFDWLGNKGISIPIPHFANPTIHPFGFLLTLDQQIRDALGNSAASSEHGMVTAFHRMTGIIKWTGQEIAGTFVAFYDATMDIHRRIKELEGHDATSPTPPPKTPKGSQTLAQLAATLGAIVVLLAGIKKWRKKTDHRLGELEKGHAPVHPGHAQPAKVNAPAAVHTLQKQMHTVQRKLKRLQDDVHPPNVPKGKPHAKPVLGRAEPAKRWQEALTPQAALALFGAGAVGFGLNFLRCNDWQRAMKRVNCEMGRGLSDLLSLLWPALLVADLCLLVDAMTAAARLFADEIDFLSSQIGGLIQCQGASRPPALKVAWYEPPPQTYFVET